MLFTGSTFILLLWFTRKVNKSANRFLAIALAIVALWTARILAIDIQLQSYLPNWDRLPMQFSMALGPLIYFYVLKLTRQEYKLRWKDLWHFSPLLLQQVLVVLQINESIQTGAAIYDTIIFRQTDWVIHLATCVSVITYLYSCLRLVERFYRKSQFNSVSDRYRYELRWLRNPLIVFGLLWLLWIPFILYYRSHAEVHTYYPFYFLLGVIIIRIAVRAHSKQGVGTQFVAPSFVKLPPPAEAKQKSNWLKKMVKANLYYQDPDLSLTSLAEKLELTPHELSRIINTVLRKSFSDFINEFRVAEVVTKMQDPAYDQFTLLGIALDSGFNSKTTFNRAFRQVTGKGPAEFKNDLKKERPYYKTEPGTHSAPLISYQQATQTWSEQKLNRNFMFKNYLKMGWRNLASNKLSSALNITGLAAGMAVALLIGLWVVNQYSYDRFLPGYAQLYQVRFNITDPKEGTHTQPAISLPLANVLRTTIPGIKYVAETDWVGYSVRDLKVGDKKLLVSAGCVNPDFLKIFKYTFIKGNRNTALNDVYSIVIDESTAKALFGNDDPVDKTIRIDNQHDVKVRGVFKDIPQASSLRFGCLLSFTYKELTESWVKTAMQEWTNNSFETFLELQPGVSQQQIEPRIKDLLVKNHPDYKRVKGEIILQSIKDQHLYSDYKDGKVSGGFIDYVRMFSIIGALVLLIACINFMNLSTAQSEKRAREVGVRKAVGSRRKDLIFQFLTESLMITFMSFLLAVLLVQLALDPFNSMAGTLIEIPWGNLAFWATMMGYVLFTGLLAGSRPAFYLSSFNAVKVLKGTMQLGKAAALPRKILVVVQFSCSIALIISTAIIYRQIEYVKNRPIGYNTDRLVSTFMSDDLSNNYDALKNDLLQSHMVESVTKASSPLTNLFWHTGINKWPGKEAGDLGINAAGINVIDSYFKTVGMKLVAGHDFSPNWSDDTLNIVVNQAAVKRMQLKQPLNQLIVYGGSEHPMRIIGVVQDAQMESPYTPAEPTVFNHGRGPNVMIYRLATGVDPHEAIAKIGKIFDKYNPAYPFDYVFTDKAYEQKFGLEVLIGKLAGLFAGLAIFISCLGLFGLAAYVAERRTKEIGIRKVLGASIAQVWLMLSRDFVLLVLLSCVIASPIALYFLNPWLKKYEYHIGIGPDVFIWSALAALIITLITISFQAIKAAIANPVKSLRAE